MCDINCIWLFNLLVAFVLIIQQQQHVVVCTIQQQRQPHNSFRLHSSASSSSSSRDGITSYASALATKYLHQHSLPKVNVVKREIRNDRNTDFISYLSDFNMQDETSIPEDIFDQRHLREIEQKERIAGKKAGGIATDVADGDDVIDVNLPYDDSDADADAEADADIILESQRSIERNFSASDNGNTNNNSHNRDGDRDEAGKNDDGIEDRAEVRPKDNTDSFKTLNLKKTNNKMKNAMLKASKTFNTARSNDEESQQEKEITYDNSIESYRQQYTYDPQRQQLSKDTIEDDNYYDGIIDDEEDDDDGSAEYERFKLMHEQKQREQQLQKEREHLQKEKQRQDLNNLHQRQEHTSPVKKLNERTFNKPSLNGNEQRLYDDMENSADQDDNNADNNKNNDEEDEFEKSQHHGAEKSPQQQQQQQQQDAIGDIDDESSSENPSISKAKQPVKDNKAFTNMFIPRKMKRHNGAARLDDATNRYTRIKKQQQQLEDSQHNTQQQQQQNHQQSISSSSNENHSNGDGSDDVDNQDEYMPHFGATQQGVDNSKKSYYGIVNVNSTQTDDLIELKDNGASKKDNNEQHYVNDAKDVTTAIAMPTAETTPTTTVVREGNERQSLFEIEKSLRRNNKHYGHKTHKKKYKDYLRYSSLMLTRVPASPTTTTTTPASTMAPQSQQEYPAAINALDKAKGQKNEKNMIKMQKGKGKASPPSPIFVLKPKQDSEPFYEGKIHYFLETDDDDDEDVHRRHDSEGRVITKGDRVDTNDWYHKLVPLLRNGIKKGNSNSERDDRISLPGLHSAGSGNGAASGGYTPYHHYRSHHQRNHHHNHHHHNHQHQKHNHHHHMRNHAYQRKVMPKTLMVTTTPMPPPSRRHTTNSPIQELAHQITDVKEFEHYYAKWPHLARVQSQLHDEQVREQLEFQNLQQQQLGNYQDYEYDEDYFEALQSGNVEENVPPYIRKYNRRNKQLLDLLEGTLPPPTRPPQQLRWAGSKLQPGPRDSSVGSMSVRIDDEYLKEKRKRYHQRQKQIHDLFEQQRPSTTTMAPTYTYSYEQQSSGKMDSSSNNNNNNNQYENRLPDEDISISMDSLEHDENESKVWQKDLGSKLAVSSAAAAAATGEKSQIPWQRQTITATSSASLAVASTTLAPPAVVSTLKPAIFKLPSYPSIAGSFMQRPRSRSAQFAPSSGSDYRRVTPLQYMSGSNNFINAGGFVAYSGAMGKNNAQQHQNNGKSMSARFSATGEENNKGSTPKPEATNTSKNNNNNRHASASSSSLSTSSSSSSSSAVSTSSSSPASVSNTFVYHRVMDASPRLVGAGLTGRKQRLPFVAITDRRLETSKKSLTDHQKDFEQNHYPMP